MSKNKVVARLAIERFEWLNRWNYGGDTGLREVHLHDYKIPKSRYQARAPVARIWELPNGTWSGNESKFSLFDDDIIPFGTQEEAEATTIAIYLLKDRKELK